MINSAGIKSLALSKVSYPYVASVIRSVRHCEKILVSVFHTFENIADEMLSFSGSFVDEDESQDFNGNSNTQMSILLNQEALNDFIRNLDLPKISTELSASRLIERKTLTKNTNTLLIKYFSILIEGKAF